MSNLSMPKIIVLHKKKSEISEGRKIKLVAAIIIVFLYKTEMTLAESSLVNNGRKDLLYCPQSGNSVACASFSTWLYSMTKKNSMITLIAARNKMIDTV